MFNKMEQQCAHSIGGQDNFISYIILVLQIPEAVLYPFQSDDDPHGLLAHLEWMEYVIKKRVRPICYGCIIKIFSSPIHLQKIMEI